MKVSYVFFGALALVTGWLIWPEVDRLLYRVDCPVCGGLLLFGLAWFFVGQVSSCCD